MRKLYLIDYGKIQIPPRLFDSIVEKDKFAKWACSSPALDYKFMVSYKKGKTKTFEAWK